MALERSESIVKSVLPLYIFDSEFWQNQNIASDRMSGGLRRIEFVTQTRN